MNYDSLLLPATGVKGYSILGILTIIDKLKILNNIKKIIGISSGSIIGLLLSIGYKPSVIFNLSIDFNININENKENLLLNLLNIKSLYSSNEIIKFVLFFMNKKNISKDITFKELNIISKYELSIIASDITKSKLFIFNYKETPNVPILFAIKSSIAIPMIFPPVIYKDSILIDGDVYNHLPITLITKSTLIIKLDSNHNVINSHITSDFNIKNYILLILNGFIKNNYLNNYESYNKINLNINFSSIDFNLSKEDKKNLYINGIECSYRFFKRKILLKKYFNYWSPVFKGSSSTSPESLSSTSTTPLIDSSNCSILKYSVSE